MEKMSQISEARPVSERRGSEEIPWQQAYRISLAWSGATFGVVKRE